MHQILLVYIFTIAFVILVILFSLLRNDETSNRKYARVRVRVDENRRQPALPPDDEVEPPSIAVWALLAGGLLFLLMMLNA